MGTGQCPVKAYNQHLRDLIHTGKATPPSSSPTSSPWTRRPRATSTSTHRDNGWTKVTLSPAA